jgi:hypothetical protein
MYIPICTYIHMYGFGVSLELSPFPPADLDLDLDGDDSLRFGLEWERWEMGMGTREDKVPVFG